MVTLFPAMLLALLLAPAEPEVRSPRPLRVLPLGDSITRGSYVKRYPDGEPIGLPHPDGGGYRRPLQERLRANGVIFDFVGELTYGAFGRDGAVDPDFDPDHQGMAGFSNRKIISGGVVPTPRDVLATLSTKEVAARGVTELLSRFQPDLVLLLSGTNDFDVPARDRLITLIGEYSRAHLIVGTIPPQRAPRAGWEKVSAYNQSLPAFIRERQQAGQSVSWIDLNRAVSVDHLLPDGVHPDAVGMRAMADAWFEAIRALPQLHAHFHDRSVSP
jgi:lysophospholipase L1-like esterase